MKILVKPAIFQNGAIFFITFLNMPQNIPKDSKFRTEFCAFCIYKGLKFLRKFMSFGINPNVNQSRSLPQIPAYSYWCNNFSLNLLSDSIIFCPIFVNHSGHPGQYFKQENLAAGV